MTGKPWFARRPLTSFGPLLGRASDEAMMRMWLSPATCSTLTQFRDSSIVWCAQGYSQDAQDIGCSACQCKGGHGIPRRVSLFALGRTWRTSCEGCAVHYSRVVKSHEKTQGENGRNTVGGGCRGATCLGILTAISPFHTLTWGGTVAILYLVK